MGFVTFRDPPLPDAREVLSEMRARGVSIKILTGDNELVARHVCEVVGLDVGRVVLGSDLEGMIDTTLLQVAEANMVFARVAPAQKNRIILALRAHKHEVGTWATASTTRPVCTPPMWASAWREPLTSPATPPISSCSSRDCGCCSAAFWRAAAPTATS